MEYDVVSTLREPRPRGARPRRRGDLGAIRSAIDELQAAHRLQPARGLRRRPHLRPERRQLPRAAARAVHRVQPARAHARPRQGPLEEAARLPPHPDPGVRRRPRRPRGAGRSASSFPLFVKSLTQEGSIGISQASLVEDEEARGARPLRPRELGTDALVERYIDGRELYVGVLGNHRLRCFPLGAPLRHACRRTRADRHRAAEVEPGLPEEARHHERAGARTCRTGWPTRIRTSASASTASSS